MRFAARIQSIFIVFITSVFSFLLVLGISSFAIGMPSGSPAGESDGGLYAYQLKELLTGSTNFASYYATPGTLTVRDADKINGVDSLPLQRKLGTECTAGSFMTNVASDGTIECDGVIGINGVCGTADGVARSSFPAVNHCSVGVLVDVDNLGDDGIFNWKCSGEFGGGDTSCSANRIFTLRFNGNGSTAGSTANQSMVFSVPANLNANGFTKDGHSFTGWSVTPTGIVNYQNGSSYTIGSGSATIYAIWSVNSYTITFNINGGDGGSMSNQTMSYGVPTNLSSNSFSRSGHSFAGWATSAAGAVVYADGASYTIGGANVTLYAKWTPTPQNGVCDNTAALACSIGSTINDNGQTACSTTHTWNCSGVNSGATSPQCSFYNGVCPVNGVCSSTPFACSAGNLDPNMNEATPKESYERGCYYDWQCDGLNGGTGIGCNATVGCFAPLELVMTPSGETPISELRVGDSVMSYEESTGRFVQNVIDRVIIHDGESNPLNNFTLYPLLNVVIDTQGVKSETKVTSNHLYFSPSENVYKPIGNFSIGERVTSIDGDGYIVSMEKMTETPIVYNLHMRSSPNNYLVNGVVVHNEKLAACEGCVGPGCNATTAWGAPAAGSCDNTAALGCTIGLPINDNSQTACNTTRTWNCDGLNGGAQSAQCSIYNGACAPVPQAGVCNNSVALGCSVGGPINDNSQTACNTTRGWNCSGVNGGSDSPQCSYGNPACINGVCNPLYNGQTLPGPYTWASVSAVVCSTGTPIEGAGFPNGPWTWNCNSPNGGTNVSCSASKAPALDPHCVFEDGASTTRLDLGYGQVANATRVMNGDQSCWGEEGGNCVFRGGAYSPLFVCWGRPTNNCTHPISGNVIYDGTGFKEWYDASFYYCNNGVRSFTPYLGPSIPTGL